MINYYYLLTKDEAYSLYGNKADAFRYDLKGEVAFANKTATDKKAEKLGLNYLLDGKYLYTDEERREICETPDWTSPDETEVG